MSRKIVNILLVNVNKLLDGLRVIYYYLSMGFDLLIYRKDNGAFEEDKNLEFDGRPSYSREFVHILHDICTDGISEEQEVYPGVFETTYYRYNITDDQYDNVIKEINKLDGNNEYFASLVDAMRNDPFIFFYDSW